MNKQAYDFLNSARVLHLHWLRLKAKHDELEYCLMPKAIRYDKDKVQSSPEDAMSKIIAEINALEVKMAVVQRAKTKKIDEIYKAIEDLESDEESTALAMRYINRVPVSDIADAMGYAEPTIYKFLNQGGEHILKSIRNIKTDV